ncbi:MAG: hypothetical protein ABIK26_06575, partial [Candidatus Omnitrophota bacterium]
KLNLFLGHDYRDSGERKEALLRYEKAQRIFEIYKSIPEASFWLNDTNRNIKEIVASDAVSVDENVSIKIDE